MGNQSRNRITKLACDERGGKDSSVTRHAYFISVWSTAFSQSGEDYGDAKACFPDFYSIEGVALTDHIRSWFVKHACRQAQGSPMDCVSWSKDALIGLREQWLPI
jgi:hypothetical protein